MFNWVFFLKKYLWSCGCHFTNFMIPVNWRNLKTEIQSEIITVQIIKMQI